MILRISLWLLNKEDKNCKQKRILIWFHFRWSTYQETPGREFALEQWRKIEEEQKFKHIKEEESKSSSGDANSQSEGESESSNNSEHDVEEFMKIAQKDGVPKLSELEKQANIQLKREKYQGPIERFVKKIGYGGNKAIKDSVKVNVRGIMQSKNFICFQLIKS